MSLGFEGIIPKHWGIPAEPNTDDPDTIADEVEEDEAEPGSVGFAFPDFDEPEEGETSTG